ncbi:MAG: ABC transporter ATP-binding protein [Pseudomonadota bacterium]
MRKNWLGSDVQLSGNEFWALQDVTFDIALGEAVAIIGRNGSGKSTLLQLIVGTLSPSEGRIRTKGRISALLELGAGFNPEFSGIENVRLNATLLGLSPEEIETQLPFILDFAEIGDYITQPVKTYSSGMYVRLAFSVVAHSKPELLIIDEALAVGDVAFQAKCMTWIRRYKAQGGSLLFVSHDVASVRTLCDRAIYLEHGQIKAIGPAGLVSDQYLRDIHQALNRTLQAPDSAPNYLKEIGSREIRSSDESFSRKCKFFAEKWANKPFGTGEARVRLAELFNAQGLTSDCFEFNELVCVQIYVECLQACTASINYKIRDRHQVAVAGADFLIVEHELLNMEASRFYQVEYKTHLPLQAGDYSLRLSISIPIEKHAQAIFLDIVEVALLFKVLPSPLGHIYTHTYLTNSVKVHSLQQPI